MGPKWSSGLAISQLNPWTNHTIPACHVSHRGTNFDLWHRRYAAPLVAPWHSHSPDLPLGRPPCCVDISCGSGLKNSMWPLRRCVGHDFSVTHGIWIYLKQKPSCPSWLLPKRTRPKSRAACRRSKCTASVVKLCFRGNLRMMVFFNKSSVASGVSSRATWHASEEQFQEVLWEANRSNAHGWPAPPIHWAVPGTADRSSLAPAFRSWPRFQKMSKFQWLLLSASLHGQAP